MEPLLRPWFKEVDRLLPTVALSPLGDGTRAPGWRVQLYGGDAVGRAREVPVRSQIEIDDALLPEEQRTLREACELFALALRIHCGAFMDALAVAMPWITTAWTYEPFADDERLQVQVIADLNASDTNFFRDFVARDATAVSDKYTTTRRALLALGKIREENDVAVEPPLRLLMQLEIVPGEHSPDQITAMLRAVDRSVFDVSKILVVLSPLVAPAPLVELFRVLHTFRATAEIEVNIDVPASSSDRTKLVRWKWFLDLAARQVYGDSERTQDAKPWVVSMLFGDPAKRSAGRAGTATSLACLSALAHVGDHVASATTTMALEDPGNARHVRARYLGYLLRAGNLTTLTIKDQSLSTQDVDNIRYVYGMTTREGCLSALHVPAWHGRKAHALDDKNASKFAAKPTEMLGLMHDLSSSDTTADVYLAGFGQCEVSRSFLLPMAGQKSTPLGEPRLKSLDLLLLSGQDTVIAMVGLATVVGRGLEKLQLEIENGSYSLRSLRIILEACPSLRKLVVKPVRIVQEDDELAFAAPDPRVPLESLTIELTPVFGDSSGIPALCRLVGSYTAELKEFILFAEQRVFADRTAVRFVHELFLQRMPMLEKLRIIGFCSGYLRSLWSRRRASSLRVLMLESVMWNEPDWTAFCAALSDPTHPLAQSLHTLHLKLTGLEALDELHGMLEKNPYLVNVAIDVTQGVRNRPEFMRLAKATDGRQMRHLKKTLSGRHKAAFLSATKAANVSIEIQNLVSIFDYAATAETRYVRVHLVTAQRQPMF